ncbi:hypothetical protein NT01EI_1900 [Edwardsiella ictaluri 93-146]|uniref:Uncharacterized protein n=1 Tax=Edwardsiella ictaluri (strain 93-146) TaxID=634503 RepID=C5B860_EDWI9|nr:hypothetical protein NT01EI_1900 [Edwardsiella ictaluri 93-146]
MLTSRNGNGALRTKSQCNNMNTKVNIIIKYDFATRNLNTLIKQ